MNVKSLKFSMVSSDGGFSVWLSYVERISAASKVSSESVSTGIESTVRGGAV